MIDPRRLRILKALADHGTVTAAAKALYMTPSAVSQQLAALEAEAGHALLERRGRAVTLTAAGSVLASHAAVIGEQIERAEADLAAVSAGAIGEVVIASFATAIIQVVAPTVAALGQLAPNVKIQVRDAEGHTSLRLLRDGDVDIAIAVGHHEAMERGDTVVRQPLYVEPFDAVLPPGHPLRTVEKLTLDLLASSAWITPWPGNPIQEVILKACAEAGFQPRVECVSDDFRATCSLVAAGAGVALIPRSAIHTSDLSPAIVRPVTSHAPTRRVFAAVRRGRVAHPLLKLVLRHLREHAHRLTT